MRKNKKEYRNVAFTDVIRLDGIRGRRIDLELTVRPGDSENMYRKFALRFAQDDTYQTALSFRVPEERSSISAGVW